MHSCMWDGSGMRNFWRVAGGVFLGSSEAWGLGCGSHFTSLTVMSSIAKVFPRLLQ